MAIQVDSYCVRPNEEMACFTRDQVMDWLQLWAKGEFQVHEHPVHADAEEPKRWRIQASLDWQGGPDGEGPRALELLGHLGSPFTWKKERLDGERIVYRSTGPFNGPLRKMDRIEVTLVRVRGVRGKPKLP